MFGLFKPKGYNNVAQQDVQQLLKDKKAKVLDVRTKSEMSSGKIKGALNLDVMSYDFGEKIAKLDATKNYIVYCRSGARSGRACKAMVKAGFTGNIYNLKGGILLWKGVLN